MQEKCHFTLCRNIWKYIDLPIWNIKKGFILCQSLIRFGGGLLRDMVAEAFSLSSIGAKSWH